MNRNLSFLALLGGLSLALAMLLTSSGTAFAAQGMRLSSQDNLSEVNSSTPTTITLVSSPNPAAVGQTVSFTATVFIPPWSGAPTEAVQYKVDGTNLGAPVTLSGRKANINTSWPASGLHEITAVYSGDTSFIPNTSATMEHCTGFSSHGTAEENSFIISNEPPGYLIHKLIAIGYGSSSLYTVTLYLKTLPGADAVLSDAFIDTLANAPASSEIFNIPLSQLDFNGAVVVSTDGTTQIVNIYGKEYDGKPGFIPIRTETSGVGKVNFIYSANQQAPLTSWNIITSVGGGAITIMTTYHAFAVAWDPGYWQYLPRVVR